MISYGPIGNPIRGNALTNPLIKGGNFLMYYIIQHDCSSILDNNLLYIYNTHSLSTAFALG